MWGLSPLLWFLRIFQESSYVIAIIAEDDARVPKFTPEQLHAKNPWWMLTIEQRITQQQNPATRCKALDKKVKLMLHQLCHEHLIAHCIAVGVSTEIAE